MRLPLLKNLEKGSALLLAAVAILGLTVVVTLSVQRQVTQSRLVGANQQIAEQFEFKRTFINLVALEFRKYVVHDKKSTNELISSCNREFSKFSEWYSDSYQGIKYTVSVCDNNDAEPSYNKDADYTLWFKIDASYANGSQKTYYALLGPGSIPPTPTPVPTGTPTATPTPDEGGGTPTPTPTPTPAACSPGNTHLSDDPSTACAKVGCASTRCTTMEWTYQEPSKCLDVPQSKEVSCSSKSEIVDGKDGTFIKFSGCFSCGSSTPTPTPGPGTPTPTPTPSGSTPTPTPTGGTPTPTPTPAGGTPTPTPSCPTENTVLNPYIDCGTAGCSTLIYYVYETCSSPLGTPDLSCGTATYNITRRTGGYVNTFCNDPTPTPTAGAPTATPTPAPTATPTPTCPAGCVNELYVVPTYTQCQTCIASGKNNVLINYARYGNCSCSVSGSNLGISCINVDPGDTTDIYRKPGTSVNLSCF